MRRVIFLSFVVLAAGLGASAYVLAGPPSQGMTAFALVDPNCNPDNPTQCGPPRLVDAQYQGLRRRECRRARRG